MRRFIKGLAANQQRADRLKDLARRMGYNPQHATRVIPYEVVGERIATLGAGNLDVLEISAGHYWQKIPFRSFRAADYPDFDICSDQLEQQFDLIIADNVFEHLPYPNRAVRNVYAMLRPGGTFVSITPFLIRVHEVPLDCSRWTETGFKYLLNEGGFPMDGIETGSWGNRSIVKANFNRWARWGLWRSRRNEPNFPLSVWAFAVKPIE